MCVTAGPGFGSFVRFIAGLQAWLAVFWRCFDLATRGVDNLNFSRLRCGPAGPASDLAANFRDLGLDLLLLPYLLIYGRNP